MALSCRFIIRYIVAKWHVLLWGLFFFSQTIAVNKDNFKTCDHSGFCKRQRHVQPGHSPYAVLLDSLVVKASSVEIQVLNRKNNIRFKLEVFALASNTARVKINEWAPIRPRYEIPVGDVLIGEPKQQQLTVLSKDAGRLVVGFEKNQVIINVDPLRIDFISNNEPIVSINTRGLLRFEHLQTKEDAKPGGDAQEADVNTEEKQGGDSIEEEKNDEKVSAPPNAEEADMWEETFKTFTDSKPHGPTSVGVDISFPGFEHVYGIPEHAETLSLKTTTSTDPYRLYNLDVFEYDLYNPMALYGSVPVMIAHNEKRAVGIFWQNAAETWIDISSNVADKNLFSKMIDFVKGDKDIPQTDTHWFSESGIIDVFIMLGPHPKDVFYQYSQLTGATPLPPLFGLAYHQSRWNYNDEEDVKNVDANFDKHDIPCDVIWLDIEHTDGKRYFTWDQLKFPHPEEMVQSLSSKGRKLVTIVDPHIKRDDNYKIYSEAKSKNYFIKNKDGNEYDGWCWPGSSSWPDYLNPEIRNWWAAKFDPAEYVGSSLDVYTWNDMNEPSVFNGPEITMHKDAIHLDGLEHREIHNIYGMYVHRATHEGLLMRTQNQERTFVLSRAFFAGSQRFGAVWTGDNIGEWSHLKISLPMILSLNLVGITFSGADVGGFFRNPDQELLTRWYQAASFQPFFRTHAHLDTKRREPWLLSEQNKNIIRNAIHTRYTFLSYWYLLFYNSEKTGQPVMAPIWVEFPTDSATFKMDDQYLVGPAILVKPIVEQSVTGTSIYFPGTNEIWYDILNFKSYQGGTSAYVEAPLEKIPVFQRGGYIIPRKYRMRRSSTLMKNDPFTLFVCLNKEGTAKGEVYTDDYHSLHYKKGEFAHRKIVFDNNRLVNGNLDPSSSYKTNEWVERVLIVGLEKQPARVLLTIEGSSSHLQFSFYVESKVLIIKKPGVNIAKDWTITLE